MKIYILYKNGNYEYTEYKKKLKLKPGKINSIMIECWHPVFGIFYVAQDVKTFKNTIKYASKSTISYNFLDGMYVDENDEDLFVKNKYWYNKPEELFSKIMEIIISENILNDIFWITSSFFQYVYDNVKIKLKGGKKKKTLSGPKFIAEYIDKPNIFRDKIIKLKNGKWENKNIKKSSGKCFVELYKNIFFRVDLDIFKLGKYALKQDIYYVYLEEEITSDMLICDRAISPDKKLHRLYYTLEVYISRYIVEQLERWDDEEIYQVINTVDFKNKKLKKKKKYKFEKFVRKYFVDIDKY